MFKNFFSKKQKKIIIKLKKYMINQSIFLIIKIKFNY